MATDDVVQSLLFGLKSSFLLTNYRSFFSICALMKIGQSSSQEPTPIRSCYPGRKIASGFCQDSSWTSKAGFGSASCRIEKCLRLSVTIHQPSMAFFLSPSMDTAQHNAVGTWSEHFNAV
ncbi:uncharacterized protein LOC120424534 [Culex pipiens pallens]|uniref:uncharacterized protein LOC120424534 n=1 Tax=Culex pipiens pallens TaxID=42434 RepID=UPI0019543AA2|nr:uncharacterized protein LOC120424534 [Culex pipiens pallens]